MKGKLVVSHLLALGAGLGLGFAAGRWTAPEEQLDTEGLARMLAPLAEIPVVAEIRVAPDVVPTSGGEFEVSVLVQASAEPSEVTFRLVGPGGKSEPYKIRVFQATGNQQWAGKMVIQVGSADPSGNYTIQDLLPRNQRGQEGLIYDEPGKPVAVVKKK